MTILKKVIAGLPWGLVKEIRNLVKEDPMQQAARRSMEQTVSFGDGIDAPFEDEPEDEPTSFYRRPETKNDVDDTQYSLKSGKEVAYGTSLLEEGIPRPVKLYVRLDRMLKIRLYKKSGQEVLIEALSPWERDVELPRHVADAIAGKRL